MDASIATLQAFAGGNNKTHELREQAERIEWAKLEAEEFKI
jgi:hypothetical protein